MEDSILTLIKKLIGMDKDYGHFDIDLITHINSTFMILNQLGVGPDRCFHISSDKETWSEFLGDATELEAVKGYVYMKARLIFDPPTSSAHLEALKASINEFEWRLNVAVEPK